MSRTSRSGALALRRASSCTSTTPQRGSSSARELYDAAEPVNLGVGREITIRELAALIASLSGFRGRDPLGHDEARWAASTHASIRHVRRKHSASKPALR